MNKWFSVDGVPGNDDGNKRSPQETWAAVILAAFVLTMGIVYSGARNRKMVAEAKSSPQSSEPGALNHLAGSTSPYLLEHARNPVDWYPWGPEALARARNENKPIFLSVGYSACHWCHVMEREDFENSNIARIMNASFVCIKVDREERPDVDDQYQTAVQIITGSGGWPMSVWLTPDLKPFHAGTYIPAAEFESVLGNVASLWNSKRDTIIRQADAVARRMQQVSSFSSAKTSGKLPANIDDRALASITAEFDKTNGGFGDKPKFPEAPRLIYLLDRYRATHRKDLLAIVTSTLDHIAEGGIRDQLDGGFHRYCTDAKWQVPHFEKMLYDQALLADCYLDAFAATFNPRYLQVAKETLGFVLQNMTDATSGGFYTSIDADSDAEEGKFYVWTRNQIVDVLGKEAGERFNTAYGVAAYGNFQDDMNVLHQPQLLSVAQELTLAPLREKLLDARARRIHPTTDDKIVCGLNGLMIEAMARAYALTGDARYRAAAEKAGEYIAARLMRQDGTLLRESRAGAVGSTPGFLDDYAYLTRGLLANYRAFHDSRWLSRAELVENQMSRLFWGRGGSAGFASPGPDGVPVANIKDGEDGALFSVNGVAAMVLIELASTHSGSKPRPAVEIDRLKTQASQTVDAFTAELLRAPGAYPTLLLANQRIRELKP